MRHDPMLRAMQGFVVGLLLALGASGGAADETPALGEPITDPAEIKSRMAGNTLSGVLLETGNLWTEYYCDSGRSLYEFGAIARGKWWVESGKVCFSYEYDDYQRPVCFDMFAKSGGYLVFYGLDDSGAPQTFLSRPPVKGDPFHLEERAAQGCTLEPSV
jgi:hypothetical protein